MMVIGIITLLLEIVVLSLTYRALDNYPLAIFLFIANIICGVISGILLPFSIKRIRNKRVRGQAIACTAIVGTCILVCLIGLSRCGNVLTWAYNMQNSSSRFY